MKWFKLSTPETWWCPPAPRWVRERIKENVLCSICERLLPGWFPRPIDVVYNRQIQSYHVLESSQPGIALIDIRLLEQLRPHLPPSAIGKALDKAGCPVPTHATIYPKDVVARRDNQPLQKVSVCPECGTIRVSSWSTEPDYLMRYEVGDRPCVMDRIGCIFVSESVANSLELSNIHPLFLQEMEVKEKPVDGLRYPSDPPWVEGRDATIHWDPKKPEG